MAIEDTFSKELIKLLLPEDIFEFFEVTSLNSTKKEVHICLDEINVIPYEYKDEKLLSKGFHPAIMIQDFPLRNKACFLHVRRRRWLIDGTEKVVSRDWDTVAKGTRLTKQFATFLKGILG